MSRENDELYAVERLAKADHRYRIVLYALTIFCFLVFVFVAYELTVLERQQRQEFARRSQQSSERLSNALNEIQSYVERSVQENKIQNEETKRYITCLLLYPIDQRTIEVQNECNRQSDLPGGMNPEDFERISSGEISSIGISEVPSSSSQPTRESRPLQRDNSQSDEIPEEPIEPAPETPEEMPRTLTQSVAEPLNAYILQPTRNLLQGIKEVLL